MKKYYYAIMVGIAVIIIVLLTTVVLFNIRKANVKYGNQTLENTAVEEDKAIEKINNEVVHTNSWEEKISPNAIIIFNKYYKKCDHTSVTRENVTKEMVNLTVDEFMNLYSDWTLKSFNSDEIILYKEIDDECGEHYVVKILDDNIAIYKINNENDLELIEKTEISIKYLPQIDVEDLERGVSLVGKEELNAYIENFE